MGKVNYGVRLRIRNGVSHAERPFRKRVDSLKGGTLHNLTKNLPSPFRQSLHNFEKFINGGLGGSTCTSTLYILLLVTLIFAGFVLFLYARNKLESKKAFTFLSDSLNIPPLTPHLHSQNAEWDSQLFWGSYRPNLYFGMRHRSPSSLVAGLMWFKQGEMQLNIRHGCDSNDNVRYNWLKHDGRSFGEEEIIDGVNKLNVSFLKREHGRYGGDWTAKIRYTSTEGTVSGDATPPSISLLFYFYLPVSSTGSIIPVVNTGDLTGIDGGTLELGTFRVQFLSEGSHILQTTFLNTYAAREDLIEHVLTQGMGYHSNDRRRIGLMGHNEKIPHTNLIIYELTVAHEAELTVLFQSIETAQSDPLQRLHGAVWDAAWKERNSAFHDKFENVFHLQQKNFSIEEVNFGKMVLSNMLGGVGYFFGSSLIVSEGLGPDPVPYGPSSLFTATPSRSVFPRGFLWDEGFHQLLISKWDIDLSFQMIFSWLDVMNANGWIPREQILGLEARSKVPEKFVVQNDSNANPPTFILPLLELLKDNKEAMLAHRDRLTQALPRLDAWFHWFNTTQRGELPTAYRWHGRNADEKHQLNPLTLSSGLDDYPRASHPTVTERHLDLRCWMAAFARLLSQLHRLCGSDEQKYSHYEKWSQMLTDEKLLSKLHWDKDRRRFADYGLHSTDVHLIRPPPPVSASNKESYDSTKIRYVRTPPKERFLPTNGYVNLFPLALQLLPPESPKLKAILGNLRNRSELWTPYGLRSLSRADKFYRKRNTEHDPPYWRGAIWINMNYLIYRSLKHYGEATNGPPIARELAQTLRHNVVGNVLGELKRSGFLWEQYRDDDGAGERARPFCGWSCLTLLMMADE